MKYIDNTKLKVIIFVIFIVAILALLYFTLARPYVKKLFSKGKGQEEMIVTELAPLSRLYDSKEPNHMDERGNLIVKIGGKEYTVLPDGSVWVYDKEGNLVAVEDPAIIRKALLEAFKSDDFMASKDLLQSKIDLASLTDDEIKTLSKALGISEKDLKNLVEQAKGGDKDLKTVSDAIKLLDLTTYSDEELKQAAIDMKADYEDLKRAVEEARKKGESLSAADYLRSSILENEKQVLDNYLENLGRTDISAMDILQKLEENGRDFQSFMQDVLKQGAEKTLEDLGLGDPNKVVEPVKEEKSGILNSNPYESSYLDRPTNQNTAQEEISFLKTLNSNFAPSTQNSGSLTTYEKVNGQAEKTSFLKNMQTGTSVSEVDKSSKMNMITAGTIINATLGTGINTDLPGQITAIVSQNVFDHFTVTNVLIPKGSMLVASYDSAVSYGQNRILIAWQTLIRPDGVIIKLNGYQGIDRQGFAGQSGDVDNHILSTIGATSMASLISVATGKYASQDTTNELLNALLTASGTSANNVAQELLSNAINRQPTITVEGGTRISILVNDNVELPTYKEN